MRIKKPFFILIGLLWLTSNNIKAQQYTFIMDNDLREDLPNGEGRYSINFKPHFGFCGQRGTPGASDIPYLSCFANSIWFGKDQKYQTVANWSTYIDLLRYEEIDKKTGQITKCQVTPPSNSQRVTYDAHIRFAKGCKVRVWPIGWNTLINWVRNDDWK